MIKEAYCSKEISRLLSQKGFDIPIRTYYEDNSNNNNEVIFGDKYNWNNSPMGQISAPTHQMAMKWLREKHNILITIILQEFKVGIDALCYGIYRITEDLYQPLYNGKVDNLIDSYEDGIDAALKYCLENVI